MKKTALFIVIIAFVFLNSCKTNDDYLPNDDVITQNSTTVNQFEITTLTAQNIEFASTEYTASFNNTQVTLNVSGDILVFQVPDVPAGNYSLSASIEGENYIFSYAVNALPTITDPDAYIKEHVTDGFFRPGQIDTIVALTANMYDPQSNYANGQILKTYRTNYLNQLAQTSTADKISFAKLVAANPTFFDALEDLTSYVDSFNVARFDVTATVSPEERLAEIKAGVNSRVLKLLAQATIFAYINTLTIAEPGVNIIVGISTAGILLHRVWLLNNFLMMNLDKSLIEFGDLAITSTSQKSQSTYTFDKDHPYSLFIKANYRNLNQQDVSSQSPIISAIVTNLNKFEDFWGSLLSLVPDDFVGNSFHIKHVSATKTKNMYVNGDYLTIEVIGNNAVNVEPSGADQLIATFSTNATTDQSFSFKIQYDFDGISNGANTYDATLIVEPVPFEIFYLANIGINDFGLYSGPTDLACDNFGNIWISSDGGLYKYNSNGVSFYNTSNSNLDNNTVSHISVGADGSVYLGSTMSNSGVRKFDGVNFSYTPLPTINSNFWQINCVAIVFEDKNQTLWAADQQSIARLDNTGWTRSTWHPYLDNCPIGGWSAMDIDINNNAWFAASNKVGVLNQSQNLWTTFDNIPALALAIDNDNNVWVGTTDDRILKWTNGSWTTWDQSNFPFLLTSIKRDGIKVSPIDNHIWVCAGISVFEYNGTNWIEHSLSQEFGIYNDVPKKIVIDSDNNKWILTGTALVKLK